MKRINIGEGAMVYTVIYRGHNGDTCFAVAIGSPDKSIAWEQGRKSFKRLIALVPGNHSPLTHSKVS